MKRLTGDEPSPLQLDEVAFARQRKLCSSLVPVLVEEYAPFSPTSNHFTYLVHQLGRYLNKEKMSF